MPRTEPVVSDTAVFAAMVAVISDVGPARLTLAHVGERAGLTAGALVQRFGSKKGLLDAFAARSTENVHDLFAASERRHPDDPWAAAIEALVKMSEPIGEPRTYAHHLAWFALELADPKLRPYAERHGRSVQADVTRLLGDPARARHVRTVHQGALILWAIEPRSSLASHLRRELRAIPHP